MGKTVLVLAGDESRVAQQLREKGNIVAVMDGDPQAPAFAYADSCLISDVWKPSDCAAAAERYNRKIRKLDAVVLMADAPMTLALVNERLRLTGIAVHSAELMHDRLAQKRTLRSAGLDLAWFAEISTVQDLQRLIIARGRDLVLKPIEQLGPSTIMNLTTAQDPLACFQKIRAASSREVILAEPATGVVRLPGFLLAGHCHMAADDAVRRLVERAAQALGLTDGPVVADMVIQDGAVQIMELLPRLSAGGHYLDAAVGWASGKSVDADDLTVDENKERGAIADSSLLATHQK